MAHFQVDIYNCMNINTYYSPKYTNCLSNTTITCLFYDYST